jgi:hypothetical protein
MRAAVSALRSLEHRARHRRTADHCALLDRAEASVSPTQREIGSVDRTNRPPASDAAR